MIVPSSKLWYALCIGLLASFLYDIPEAHARQYTAKLQADHSVAITAPDGSSAVFRPRFGVFCEAENPKPKLRWIKDLKQRPERIQYNVLAWTRNEPETAPASGNQHVEDGYNPATDRAIGGGTVADVFVVNPFQTIEAIAAKDDGGAITWEFADQPDYMLQARLDLPEKAGEPLLTFTLTPRKEAWYSVAYLGAPAVSSAKAEEIWQPLIWQEKRFPDQSYLTEASRCTLPATTVTSDGVTYSVVVDPEELPFQPLPTVGNSRFGVLVRNAQGEAQPMVLAPIPGGKGSQMQAGQEFRFRLRLFVTKGRGVDAYEAIARNLFGFRDYRQNGEMGSLNGTMERMIEFAMGPWACFNADLRGSSYDTDVPGSVKNVSSLHPLSVAMVTDSPQIFAERALPMLEYALSRERFLFTTNPAVKGQNASSHLKGPGVALSELTALQALSEGKNPVLVEQAIGLLPLKRQLNLEVSTTEDIWQNYMAIYRATGEASWLEKAKAGADAYIQRRIKTRQTDFSDPDSRGMFFWTSYSPNWSELFELYEITGEARYLKAAHEGARNFTLSIYLCPVIPEGDVTVNKGGKAPSYRSGRSHPGIRIAEETAPAWRLSEIGLTSESSGTSKGHRGIFPNAFGATLLRLAAATGDEYLRALGRASIIGRYKGFPGYHINTARTTVYEKADFAERARKELNSVTSIHYNHIWPHIAILLDYLVADVAAKSHGGIDFPGQFAESYAYFQSRVYSHAPGKFFGEKAFLWMPPGLITSDNEEINYIAARNEEGRLFLAFANQSPQEQSVRFTIDPKRVTIPSAGPKKVICWDDRGKATPGEMPKAGTFQITVPPKGLAALAIDGVTPRMELQPRLEEASAPWKKAAAEINLGRARAMVINFGQQLKSGYVFLREREGIAAASLSYSQDGTKWETLEDVSYPFEFSFPIAPKTKELHLRITTQNANGDRIDSETVILSE